MKCAENRKVRFSVCVIRTVTESFRITNEVPALRRRDGEPLEVRRRDTNWKQMLLSLQIELLPMFRRGLFLTVLLLRQGYFVRG